MIHEAKDLSEHIEGYFVDNSLERLSYLSHIQSEVNRVFLDMEAVIVPRVTLKFLKGVPADKAVYDRLDMTGDSWRRVHDYVDDVYLSDEELALAESKVDYTSISLLANPHRLLEVAFRRHTPAGYKTQTIDVPFAEEAINLLAFYEINPHNIGPRAEFELTNYIAKDHAYMLRAVIKNVDKKIIQHTKGDSL